MKRAFLALSLLTALTGCNTTSNIQTPDNLPSEASLLSQIGAPNQQLHHIIEFEYNSFELPSNAAEVIEPHVFYLTQENTKTALIQGSASFEGSDHFNHQLGLARANAVRNLMIELGAPAERIEVTSVGENTSPGLPKRAAIIVY